jgi:hypothetical protein
MELFQTMVKVKFKNGFVTLYRPEIAERMARKGEVEIIKGGEPADPVKTEKPAPKKAEK